MTYTETIDYLFNQLPVFQIIGPGAYKPGLGTAYTLATAFGNPQQGYRTIHIAGTNGKGSTTNMLASVLMEAGYKVGIYTSPHIFDFRERIRVNGKKIPQADVVDFVERYQSMDLGCCPSFFELTTIMAFDYFRRAGVEIAVVEVGLGGRLDTTNIISPMLSVITNISLDHKAQLGDTEAQIAREKAGIVKPYTPVVIGLADGEVRRVFAEVAEANNSPITFAQDNSYSHIVIDDHYVFATKHDVVPTAWCELQGKFQEENINTVITALNVLNIANDEAIRLGLARVTSNTHIMGRWTTIAQQPRVICDTGHNIGAWQYLAAKLTEIANCGGLRMVIGFVNDKDITPIFDILPKTGVVYYMVTPSVKRGRAAAELQAMAQERGLTAYAYASVVDGYRQALADSKSGDTIYVGGSNFVVADLPITCDA